MKKIISTILISSVLSGYSFFYEAVANPTSSGLINAIATVQINGAVIKPGVYKVPLGTRLVDVLVRAGGLKKDAETTSLNLTSPVIDGTTFYIASKKEPELIKLKSERVYMHEKNEIVIEKKQKKTRKKKIKREKRFTTLVNINTATQEELNSLPGIGEMLAGEIIRYRTKHGKFRDFSTINNVPGIGDKKLEKLKKKIII